jgi:hypothetical protein
VHCDQPNRRWHVQQQQATAAEGDQPKQAFIPQGDRPEVGIDPDTPLSELRVRDLAALLGPLQAKSPFEVGKTPIKDFFDKPFPEVVKDYLKEIKPEKLELDGGLSPANTVGPDPGLEQVIEAVAALTNQVGQLANQVEELRRTS